MGKCVIVIVVVFAKNLMVGVVDRMKKWTIAVATAASVLALSACNNGGSEVVVETKAGDITKEELYNAMKQRVGDETIRDLVHEKVLSKKYKVSEKEIDREIEKLKEQYAMQYEMAVQQSGEKAIRDMVKLDLLRQKAAMKDIKVTEKEMKQYYDEYKRQQKRLRQNWIKGKISLN
jgi:foldase protein PrsA